MRGLDLHVAGSILVGSVLRICAVKMYGGIDADLRALGAEMADTIWDALREEVKRSEAG